MKRLPFALLVFALCACSKPAAPLPAKPQAAQTPAGLQDPSTATSQEERQRILDENTKKYNDWRLEPTKKVDY
jgi:hypothetical protein